MLKAAWQACYWEAPEFSLLLDVASPFDFLLREKKITVVMFPGSTISNILT